MSAADAAGIRVLELFSAGCGCAVADSAFHPLETLKVRQHRAPSPMTCMAKAALVDAGGGLRGAWFGLWRPGLAPTLVRAYTYAAVRVGGYPCVRDRIARGRSEAGPGFATCVSAGGVTGATAAALFTPLDVVRLRMQLNPSKFPAFGVLGTLRQIAASEGFRALWRGAGITIPRAALLSASQLATYDAAKRQLRHITGAQEGAALHVGAALLAGVVAQTLIQPFDSVKTLVQAEASGRVVDVASRLMRQGGIFRGYRVGLLRQGPVLATTLSLTESARSLFGLGAI